MRETWRECLDDLPSDEGGVKGRLTKLSGGVVRVRSFDIIRWKLLNGVEAKLEMVEIHNAQKVRNFDL